MDYAKTDEMRGLLQRAVVSWSVRDCAEQHADEEDCLHFTDLLRGGIFDRKTDLIKFGRDAREKIEAAGSKEDAKKHREDFYEQSLAAISVDGATAGQAVMTHDVAITWRQMVLCPMNRESTVEKVYELFLCVEIPKLKEDIASKMLAPVKKAVTGASIGDYDADGNGQLSPSEFADMQSALAKQMSPSSRRLLGGLQSFCAQTSDSGLWAVPAKLDDALTEEHPGRTVAVAVAMVGCVAAAAVLAASGLAARRNDCSELQEQRELE